MGEGVGEFAGTGSDLVACSITCAGISGCRDSAVAEAVGVKVGGVSVTSGFPKGAAGGVGATIDGSLAGVRLFSPMGSNRGAGGGGRVLCTGPR